MLTALEWYLARSPGSGCPTDDRGEVYTKNLREFDTLLPSYTVYYTFDDNTVWLLSITRLSDLEL